MSTATPTRTILVIEDEWLVRDAVAGAFRDDGWHVLETGTGEGALAVLREGPRVDIVFTDIQLAGHLSGWDVAEAFRAARPEIPVILHVGQFG